jgi:hypothetical protein
LITLSIRERAVEKLDIDEIIAREFSPDEIFARVRRHIDQLD